MTTTPLKTRLTSRKFWLTVLVSVAAMLLDLDEQTKAAIIASLVGTYNIGNGLQKR